MQQAKLVTTITHNNYLQVLIMAIHTKGFALVMKMFLKAIGFDRVED